jgi:hypothetical protein
MVESHLAHVRIAAVAVAPQAQQIADLIEGEAQLARAADKPQPAHVICGIVPIAAFAPINAGDEINGFVVADHLGGDARRLCCVADVHQRSSSSSEGVLTFLLWEGLASLSMITKQRGAEL